MIGRDLPSGSIFAQARAMKRLTPALLLLLAACAPTPDVHGPVDHFEYGAISHDPFWLVSVGDDSIVLTMGPSGGSADGELTTTTFPRVLSKTSADGSRTWESSDGTAVISLEARRGPCTTGGRTYADRTRVRLSGRELKGCGGPETGGAGR